ncbi:MAG: hypothetical protein JXB05_26785 [Myxococcaceae bacterium]|nr:hypothetical protein [Myxococcaceae bacterium]
MPPPLSDARATRPSWTGRRAHHGAELDAATLAAVLARATGPSWSRPGARHRAELELSDVGAPA